MEIIDLTQYIDEKMPVYPGTEPPLLLNALDIDKDGFQEKKITMFSHTGTHLDAPGHIIKGGLTLDQLPVGYFYGVAYCLPVHGDAMGMISVEEIKKQEKAISQSDYLLLCSGWSKFWGKNSYFTDYPVLTESAALWLTDNKLKGIGIDAISVDKADTENYPIHRILLGSGMVLVENLTNLEIIRNKQFYFSCFPLKIVESDGSPVRAVAYVNPGKH